MRPTGRAYWSLGGLAAGVWEGRKAGYSSRSITEQNLIRTNVMTTTILIMTSFQIFKASPFPSTNVRWKTSQCYLCSQPDKPHSSSLPGSGVSPSHLFACLPSSYSTYSIFHEHKRHTYSFPVEISRPDILSLVVLSAKLLQKTSHRNSE